MFVAFGKGLRVILLFAYISLKVSIEKMVDTRECDAEQHPYKAMDYQHS